MIFSPCTQILFVSAMKCAKLASFDSKIIPSVAVFEILALICLYCVESLDTNVFLLQMFSFLTTASIVCYNSNNKTLRIYTMTIRFFAILVACVFFNVQNHVYNSHVFFLSWLLFAVSTGYIAQNVLYCWVQDYKEVLKLEDTVVPSMKALAQLGPFGRRGNILCWSLANSLAEETFSRFIYFQCLLRADISPEYANIIQAVDFGLMHLHHGFPYGLSGMFLSFCFGLTQGILCHWTGGILIPWLVHALVDFYIFNVLTV